MSHDWQGEFVETPSARIHIVRKGRGFPVVFLHGWPETGETWRDLAGALSHHFDVIVPDLRGAGLTEPREPPGPAGTPPERLAADLRDLADALRIDRLSIVAHDIGSLAAQALALAAPARVARLFFFNCVYPGIGARWGEARLLPDLWYQEFHQQEIAVRLVGASRATCRAYLADRLTRWSHNPAPVLAHLDAWTDGQMRGGNLAGGFAWYVALGRLRRRMLERGSAPLPRVAAPTRVLWGAHDPALRVDWADRLGESFADVRLEVAEAAGHFVHLECPELAAARVLEHLAS